MRSISVVLKVNLQVVLVHLGYAVLVLLGALIQVGNGAQVTEIPPLTGHKLLSCGGEQTRTINYKRLIEHKSVGRKTELLL